MDYETGQKIQYMLPDKKGKQHWFAGVIHGVRRYEDAGTNTITKVTYLVDTGRHTRIDEIVFNHRDREITKRFNKAFKPTSDHQKNHEQRVKLISAISEHPDLPDSKLGVERVRQPEQIELTAEFIRPRK